MHPITPLQPNIIRYLVEQNKWTELTKHIMDLQSRVGLLEVMLADQEWRPIETAPKDGTFILVVEKNFPDVVIVCQFGRFLRGVIVDWKSQDGDVVFPWKWMPLPKPPTR